MPGLGAVYNRQNLKAAVHFVLVVGTFQLTHLHIMSGLFALAGTALYLVSIVDAYRTAQSIALGETAADSEARFKRSLVKASPFVGLFLIVCGIATVVQLIHPIPLIMLGRLIPVALILLGGYLVTRYFRRSGEEGRGEEESGRHYSLSPTPLGRKQKSGSVRLVGRSR
jgi:hypothetical protein